MTYDITDKKRLKRVAKLLLRYGHRVQKSVFACDINERRRRELEAKLRAEKQDEDSIMIYEYDPESAEELERASGKVIERNDSAGKARPGTTSKQQRMPPSKGKKKRK